MFLNIPPILTMTLENFTASLRKNWRLILYLRDLKRSTPLYQINIRFLRLVQWTLRFVWEN